MSISIQDIQSVDSWTMLRIVEMLNAGLAVRPLIGNPLLTPFLTLLLGI